VGIVAAITFGPYGGFHGHLDKLSFVLFARVQELGVDPGRARSQAYRLPIHAGWYKATVSHNAVLVDGSSQAPASGRLELFAETVGYAAVAASSEEAYEGVRHERLLVAMPGYLLVVDDLVSSTPRRFDWIYHNRGKNVRCDSPTAASLGVGELPGSFAGRLYIDGVKTGRTNGSVGLVFEGAAKEGRRTRRSSREATASSSAEARLDTHVFAAAASETFLATGHGPGASIQDRVPLVILGREGERVRFAAAIEPVSEGARPTVSEVTLVGTDVGPDGGDDVRTIEVRVARGAESDVVRWKVPSGGSRRARPSTLEVLEDGRRVLEAP
jgi:hypothetical protein